MVGEADNDRANAELARLRAETEKALAEAAKSNEEVARLRSWYGPVLEATKVVGAVILGLGGVTAAISGYQLSEIKREQNELQIRQLKSEIAELGDERDKIFKASAEEQEKLNGCRPS